MLGAFGGAQEQIPVLKHRFYCYSGMMSPRDQETAVIDKIVCYLSSLREGGMPHHVGPQGKHQVQPGGRRSKEKAWAQDFIMISTEKAKKSRISKFGIS